jgi:hypothetical protein
MTQERRDTDSETNFPDDAISEDVDELLTEIRRLHASGNTSCTFGRDQCESKLAYVGALCIIQIPYPPELIALATATAVFSKAFLETLGGRAGDGVANLPRRVQDLMRTCHRRKKERYDCLIGTQSHEAAARILITADLPDEARLALLDLDVAAEDLRGKLLWWDSTTAIWSPTRASTMGSKAKPQTPQGEG